MMGGVSMATSSITKEFVIRDEATYKRFMKLQEKPVNEKPRPESNRLEEGIEKLRQFSFRSKD